MHNRKKHNPSNTLNHHGSTNKALTRDLIFTKTRNDNLAGIKNLNLWGNDLQDLSLLSQMPNLEVISLSVNKVNSLKYFSECYKLQNNIKDLRELAYLKQLPQLRVLWLYDNPCSQMNGYRQIVLAELPNLVKLDNNQVSMEEKEQYGVESQLQQQQEAYLKQQNRGIGGGRQMQHHKGNASNRGRGGGHVNQQQQHHKQQRVDGHNYDQFQSQPHPSSHLHQRRNQQFDNNNDNFFSAQSAIDQHSGGYQQQRQAYQQQKQISRQQYEQEQLSQYNSSAVQQRNRQKQSLQPENTPPSHKTNRSNQSTALQYIMNPDDRPIGGSGGGSRNSNVKNAKSNTKAINNSQMMNDFDQGQQHRLSGDSGNSNRRHQPQYQSPQKQQLQKQQAMMSKNRQAVNSQPQFIGVEIVTPSTNKKKVVGVGGKANYPTNHNQNNNRCPLQQSLKSKKWNQPQHSIIQQQRQPQSPSSIARVNSHHRCANQQQQQHYHPSTKNPNLNSIPKANSNSHNSPTQPPQTQQNMLFAVLSLLDSLDQEGLEVVQKEVQKRQRK